MKLEFHSILLHSAWNWSLSNLSSSPNFSSKNSSTYKIVSNACYVSIFFVKSYYSANFAHFGPYFVFFLNWKLVKFFVKIKIAFDIGWKMQFFCCYSWVLLHFLILFMGLNVLFLLTFSFIYSTYSKKFSVLAK